MLLADFVNRETARVVGGFGVVGDAEILISPLPGRFGHDLKRIHTVREVRVRVQDAAHLAIGDKGRQLAFHRTLDLTAAFAQLRLNERQAERRVDVFFAFCGKELAPAPQSVIIEGEALAGRQRAQLIDVLRRAGREQQSRNGACRSDEP